MTKKQLSFKLLDELKINPDNLNSKFLLLCLEELAIFLDLSLNEADFNSRIETAKLIIKEDIIKELLNFHYYEIKSKYDNATENQLFYYDRFIEYYEKYNNLK